MTYAPTLYIARHATPDWSRTDIPYHRVPGPPLTEHGMSEAHALGEKLREAGVVKFYTSPLERAHRTALIAAQIVGAPVEVTYALHEVAPSDDRAEVRKRVADFWLAAGEESRTLGPIALVTHGGCVLELLNYLQVERDEVKYWVGQFDRANPIPPAGAWRTTFDTASQTWRAEFYFSPVPYQPRLVEMTRA